MNDNYAHARNSDPETSHQAAASIDVTTREARVISALRWFHPGGATSFEIADWLEMPRDSISPRIPPLTRKGLVIDSGIRRNGPSHRLAIVWRLTALGLPRRHEGG